MGSYGWGGEGPPESIVTRNMHARRDERSAASSRQGCQVGRGLQNKQTAPQRLPRCRRRRGVTLGLRRVEVPAGSACGWNQPSLASRTHWSDTWKTWGHPRRVLGSGKLGSGAGQQHGAAAAAAEAIKRRPLTSKCTSGCPSSPGHVATTALTACSPISSCERHPKPSSSAAGTVKGCAGRMQPLPRFHRVPGSKGGAGAHLHRCALADFFRAHDEVALLGGLRPDPAHLAPPASEGGAGGGQSAGSSDAASRRSKKGSAAQRSTAAQHSSGQDLATVPHWAAMQVPSRQRSTASSAARRAARSPTPCAPR